MALDKVLSTSIANGAVTAEAISNTANLVVGSISANGAELTSINATSISTGTLDTARLPATANIATAVNVGANVNITTTGISVGNSTVNTTINSSNVSIGAVQGMSGNKSAFLLRAQGDSGYAGICVTSSTSNNANKGAIAIAGPRYDTSKEQFAGFGSWDDNTNRTLYIGGGGWAMPEATQLLLYLTDYANENSTGDTVLSANSTVIYPRKNIKFDNGNGIDFSASAGGGASSSILDDYEEGTYTPVIIFNSGTPTYSYQEGYYTKIGRQVFGGGIIGINNSSTISGYVGVSLPFTASSGTFGYTGGCSSDGSGFTWPISTAGASFYSITWQISPGYARMLFVGISTSAQLIPYNATGISNSWYTRFAFSYYTT